MTSELSDTPLVVFISHLTHLAPLCVFSVNGVPWPQEQGRRNSHTFNCRLLKRPPDEVDAENQEARQLYELMQCFTVSQPRAVQEEGEGETTHILIKSYPYKYLAYCRESDEAVIDASVQM